MILTCKLRLGCQVAAAAAEPDPGFTEPEPQARAGRSALYRDSASGANYRRPASQACSRPVAPWRGHRHRHPDARERDGHWRFTGPFRFTIHAAQGGPFRGAEIAVAQQRGSVAFGPGQHAPGPRPCLKKVQTPSQFNTHHRAFAKGRRRQLNAPGRSPCASTHRRAPPAPPRRARPLRSHRTSP